MAIRVVGVVFEVSPKDGALIVYHDKFRRGSTVTAMLQDSHYSSSETVQTFRANVVERNINGDITQAAIFPKLPAGQYKVDGYAHFVRVTVVAGTITEVDWR